MRMCPEHWQMMRQAVDDRGMTGLVSRSGKELGQRLVTELEGAESPAATFDPLMSLNMHFTNEALRCGGLYLMTKNRSGHNDGHYCPICEFEKHTPGFLPAVEIGGVADQMRDWARSEGLVPPLA